MSRANEERLHSEGVCDVRLPIIALTALSQASDRERALEAGMDDVMLKPFARDSLIEKIAQWVDSSRA